LTHSIFLRFSQGYLFLRMAKEVLDAAAPTYSKMGKATQIYELKRWIHGTIQGDWYVATYFHKLHALWQKLDHYQNLLTKCAEDALNIKKMIEEERIYELLAGLNSEYDPVRVQILGGDPFSSVREAFSYVQNEESRRSTMLHSISQAKAALVGASQRNSKGDFKR
jgi:hypothetical protein